MALDENEEAIELETLAEKRSANNSMPCPEVSHDEFKWLQTSIHTAFL